MSHALQAVSLPLNYREAFSREHEGNSNVAIEFYFMTTVKEGKHLSPHASKTAVIASDWISFFHVFFSELMTESNWII